MPSTEHILHDLSTRFDAGYALIFLKTWEEARWERLLGELAADAHRPLITWSQTQGFQPAKAAAGVATEPLANLAQWPERSLILLKDFHTQLQQPATRRQIRDQLAVLQARDMVLVFIDPAGELPLELEKDAILIELPLPDYPDLQELLVEALADRATAGQPPLELTPDAEDRLIKAVLGLSESEARRAWLRALHQKSRVDDDVLREVISEKRVLAAGSDLLKFYDLQEGVDDVGGLDQLKIWLARRASAYGPEAQAKGIPAPKGVLLLGVQGCGKSLTARAAARLLSFPLIRLDMANLMAAGRGETERNLRVVLDLVESIAPVVLWLDELEKGFAGMGEGGGNDATVARLVGTLLTWMSEVSKPVFVVATANSVTNLPPELLRRGRFDELFFIDLPNFHERQHILKIHLGKRGWKRHEFDLAAIAEATEGYSGAELEQVVASALIEAFGEGRHLSQDDLERARKATVPLSITMEEKVFELRQWAESRCRRATSDSRVNQLLEEEERLDAQKRAADAEMPVVAAPALWQSLAETGQLKTALVDYIRDRKEALFPELMDAFGPYLVTTGHYGLASRANPNVVLWTGLSGELAELIVELVTARRIYVAVSSRTRYGDDAPDNRLTLLEEVPSGPVAKPAWLPVMLRMFPDPNATELFGRIGRMKFGRKAE